MSLFAEQYLLFSFRLSCCQLFLCVDLGACVHRSVDRLCSEIHLYLDQSIMTAPASLMFVVMGRESNPLAPMQSSSILSKHETYNLTIKWTNLDEPLSCRVIMTLLFQRPQYPTEC